MSHFMVGRQQEALVKEAFVVFELLQEILCGKDSQDLVAAICSRPFWPQHIGANPVSSRCTPAQDQKAETEKACTQVVVIRKPLFEQLVEFLAVTPLAMAQPSE